MDDHGVEEVPEAKPQGLCWRDRAALLVIALAVLLPGVAGVSLFDRDEGWYAEVAREMAATGDWIVPRYLGRPWMGKPPLLYWCIFAMWHLLGPTGAAARLVSIAAMCVAVQGLATLAARVYGRPAAWVAAVVFVTAALPAAIGRLVLTDGLLLACVVWAAVWLYACATRGATVVRCGLFWLWLGLGILAKGPAALLFVSTWAVALAAFGAGRRWLRSAAFWLTLPVCLLVAAPWYVLVAQRAGATLMEQFVGYEIVARLVRPPHGHAGAPGYYVLTSLAGWLPWTALVPGAILEAWQQRRADRPAALLLAWLGLAWLILELVPGKLPHYVLPCYVPIAILFGRMWVRGVRGELRPVQWRVLELWALVPVVLGTAGAALAVLRGWPGAVAGAALAFAVAFVVVGWLVRRRRTGALLPVAAVGAIVFYAVCGLWTLPALEPLRLSRQIAEQANGMVRRGEVVRVCGYDEPTMFFYLRAPARVVEPAGLRTAEGLIIAGADCLEAAGIEPDASWRRLSGLNYVHMRREVVWVGRPGGPGPPRAAERWRARTRHREGADRSGRYHAGPSPR